MDKQVLSATDSGLSWLLAFAFSQIAVMVFTLLIVGLAAAFGVSTTSCTNFLDSALGYFLTTLTLEFVLVIVFLFYNKRKQNSIIQKPEFKKILFYICCTIIAFFALYPIIICLDKLFISFGAELTEIPYELTTKNYIVSVLSIALIPAVCEELIFRGLIFKGLKNYGKAFSIFISALMFAIFHMSYQQFAYPLLMGLLFGVIMYYENNIIYTISAHFINNFLSLTISYFNLNLYFEHWLYIFLALILLLAFVAVIVYFMFRKNQAKKDKLNFQKSKYLILSFAIMIILWVIINIFAR